MLSAKLAFAESIPLSSNEVWSVASAFAGKGFFPARTRVIVLEPPTEQMGVWRASLEPKGFILLNADENDLPIMGFSSESNLNLVDRPENALRSYVQSRATARHADPRGPEVRRRLKSPTAVRSATLPTTILTPPLSYTRWDQWRYYNGQCPTITGAEYGYDGRAPAGCVATAFAQLMRLYSWPSKGDYLLTYTDFSGASQGTYTYDFSQALPWDDLKDSYGVFCSEDARCAAAISQLVFSMCVAANTDFEASSSGAYPSVATYNIGECYHYLSGTELTCYDRQFAPTIENELAQNRALVLVINTSGGRHAVLADGLATDSGIRYVHINYGWSGQNDGWYSGYDSPAPSMFSELYQGVRPDVGGKPIVACGPNFIELVATNGLTASAEIELRTVGTNSVDYTISPGDSWVNLSATNGTASVSPTMHQVVIDSTELSPGVHNTVLTITGPAANLPRNIVLRLYKPEPPTISRQPPDQVTADPTTAIIVVPAQDGSNFTPCPLEVPLQYHWYWNGQPLAGANTCRWQAANYGVFQCVVTGLGGSVTSRAVTISAPPTTLCIGNLGPKGDDGKSTAVLGITSNSAFPLLYQLECSTNLQTWTAVGTPFPLAAACRTNLSLNPSVPRAFYRVRQFQP